ncbi:MAG TPA: hypothetical protein VE291_09345, partial [Terracidiphilus sp.]|nr:hypothetical protein [Terracidiphilus sp.]
MFRKLLVAAVFAANLLPARSGAQTGATPHPPTPDAPAAAVTDAEAAIVKSDWKTAADKLDAWLATHPSDSRALFDAGYVADAQNRTGDAAGFYQRAVQVNPRSFEAR